MTIFVVVQVNGQIIISPMVMGAHEAGMEPW